MGKQRGLTARQQRFVEEYLIDLNGSAAYRRTYPNVKSEGVARANAARLLAKANVAAAVALAQAERSRRTLVAADDVIRELATVGFSDLRHFAIDDDGRVRLAEGAPEQAMRAVSLIKRKVSVFGEGNLARREYVTEIRLWSKVESLKLLGQHLRLFGDTDADGSTRAPIQINFIEAVLPSEPAVEIIDVEGPAGTGDGDGRREDQTALPSRAGEGVAIS